MQIPKISLLVCALALGAAMTTPAVDTPAQAAARVALEAKLKELNAQCPPASPVEAPPAVKNKTSAPASQPVSKVILTPRMQSELAPAKKEVVLKPVSSETSPVTCLPKAPADKTSANAKAKQDAAQAAAQLKAKKEAQAAADAKAAADKKAQKAAADAKAKQDAAQAVAQLKAKKEAQAAADAKAAADKKAQKAAAEAKAKQDAAQAAAQLKAKKEAQAAADAAKPGKMDSPGAELGLHQIAAPALPIAASKENRLQTLLGKYKINQITPEEYHTQRAAILAEP